MSDRLSWRNFDWPLFWAVLLLCGVGVGMIYSATANTIDMSDLWLRQAIFVGSGIVALLVATLVDYRQLEILALPAFLLFVLSLLAVDNLVGVLVSWVVKCWSWVTRRGRVLFVPGGRSSSVLILSQCSHSIEKRTSRKEGWVCVLNY